MTERLLSAVRPELQLSLNTARDLAPIVLVVAFFQLTVLRQPFPDLVDMLVGLALVLIGLALFIRGLDMALFPIGEALAVGQHLERMASGVVARRVGELGLRAEQRRLWPS